MQAAGTCFEKFVDESIAFVSLGLCLVDRITHRPYKKLQQIFMDMAVEVLNKQKTRSGIPKRVLKQL